MDARFSEGSDSNQSAIQKTRESQTASEVLHLLARELPKLLETGNVDEEATTAPTERCRKRKQPDDHLVFGFADEGADLPERTHLDAIVVAYFSRIHPWIPLIHQARFKNRFSDLSTHNGIRVILHAMVIAAARFVPNSSVDSHEVLQARRKMVVSTAMESVSVENLQALVILVWDDIGRGDASKAWSIIGSLSRTVEYLQLTQEQSLDEIHPFCQPYRSLPFTDDWTVVEERRRVFWNIFVLDRLCSVTMGWSSSLTSTDVRRRLPCDGVLWRKEEAVVTPYFGIWDKSRGGLHRPIEFESRGSFSISFEDTIEVQSQTNKVPSMGGEIASTTDVSSIGALAYNIEATESMSRIMTHFLQQQVNMEDRNEVEMWLTRFKELDLRLVHWKMLLPQKWKANLNLTRQVLMMDPNLTTAHVTHNASMILLHQTIAYPPVYWRVRSRLPSRCSAEACFSAGVEISRIAAKYLSKSIAGSPISSQFAFCLFLAGRVLLIHWKYAFEHQLPADFWSIINSLEEMSRRWDGICKALPSRPNIFMKYASRLRELHGLCSLGGGFEMNVMDYTIDISYGQTSPNPTQTVAESPRPRPMFMNAPSSVPDFSQDWLNTADVTGVITASQFLLDQDFIDMDRVITFDDGSMFMAGL
jgi:hypothetical protein